MSHIFISYSTQDKDYAYKLADELRERGFNIWIDNDALRSSDNWWRSIVDALTAADAVVVLMSPSSEQSRWVEREVHLADNLRKPTFPLLLKGENFPIFVTTQFEDVTHEGLPSGDFFGKLGEVSFRVNGRGGMIAGDKVIAEPDEPTSDPPRDPRATDEVLVWTDTREMEMIEDDITSPDFSDVRLHRPYKTKAVIDHVPYQKTARLPSYDLEEEPIVKSQQSLLVIASVISVIIIGILGIFVTQDPFEWFVDYPIAMTSSSNPTLYLEYPRGEWAGIFDAGIELEVLSRTTDFTDTERDYQTYLEVRYSIPRDNPTRDIVELKNEFEDAIADIRGDTITGWVDVDRMILPDDLTLSDIPVNADYDGIIFDMIGFQGSVYQVQRGDTADTINLDCSSAQAVIDANPIESLDDIRTGMVLLIPGLCG